MQFRGASCSASVAIRTSSWNILWLAFIVLKLQPFSVVTTCRQAFLSFAQKPQEQLSIPDRQLHPTPTLYHYKHTLKRHRLLIRRVDFTMIIIILPYAGDDPLLFKEMLISTVIFLAVSMANTVIHLSKKCTLLYLWT